jgi:hypothetical protein
VFDDEFVGSELDTFSDDWFLLEMSPCNIVVPLFSTVNQTKGKKPIIDVTTSFELLFTHMLFLILFCRHEHLITPYFSPRQLASSVLLQSGPSCRPPLTVMFQSMLTKVKLAFAYLYI